MKGRPDGAVIWHVGRVTARMAARGRRQACVIDTLPAFWSDRGRMHILVITNLYPSRRRPAFGTFVAGHVRALRRGAATVDVASIQDQDVHRRILSKYVGLAARALWSATRAIARGKRPRVVEAHIAYPTGLLAWPIARLVGAKLVLYVHGADIYEVGTRSPLHRRASRLVFSRADLIVANSGYTRGLLRETPGVPHEKVVVLSPGIDTTLFQPPADARRRPDEILYVGRLDPQKGVGVLIEAVSLLADQGITLRIMGDGPAKEVLEAEAARLRVPVRFEGAVPPGEVALAMAEAGVLAVPSAHGEALGLVAIEGMAMGALVVASDTGGLSEVIQAGVNGWLVPPRDAGALARALSEALASARQPDDRRTRTMRKAGMQTAAQHDVYAIGERILVAYDALVGSEK